MISIKIDGIDEFLKDLKQIQRPATQRRVLESALKYAIVPVRRHIRTEIRKSGAIYRNILVRNIGSKVKVLARARFGLAIAGAKSRGTGGKYDPARYIHLADLGSSPHTGPNPWVYYDTPTGRFKTLRDGRHPGAKSHGWRRRAARRSRREVNERFSRRFLERYTLELVK